MASLIRILSRLQPYNIVKGVRYLRHFGLKAFWVRFSERMEPDEVPYGPWYAAYAPTEAELGKQHKTSAGWNVRPLISVLVPVYRTDPAQLRAMIDSVLAQTYDRWELCLANADPSDTAVRKILADYAAKDNRIRVRELAENKGISGNTNAAIEMAKGDWIALLDHDDLLSPAALFLLVRHMQSHPRDQVIYTDEDKVRANGEQLEHLQPNLKPDFNLDLLRSNNYICHLLCVKRTALPEGLFRADYDGAQDYDFIFRTVEKAGYQVGHVPEIAYHWRIHAASTADNPLSKQYAYAAGQRAIEEHLRRCGEEASVEQKKDFGFYRVTYPVQGKPLVSIIIPNKDHPEMLRDLLTSIWEKSTYKNVELLIVENNSTQPETFKLYQEIDGKRGVRVLRYEGGFNYAAINNFGVRQAKGEYLLLLNNDMKIISPDWIEQLLGTCQRKQVGAVGARLYYPDDTYQHAGIVIGIGGIAGSMFVDMKRGRGGYMHKAELMQDLSAVTAACMMIPRTVYEQVHGFEEKLTVAFNDVDLCLRIRKAGYLVVYNPYAELYHLESKTRGTENTKQKVRRFQTEIEFMRTRWEALIKAGDPMYNKNLSLSKWNYSLKDGEHMR